MLVCDRCGAKIAQPNDRTKKTLTIYSRAACYIGHYVDLCDDCVREFDGFMRKAESYFMVTGEKPSEIFDDSHYWTD